MKGGVCAAYICQASSHQCFSSGVMGDGKVSGHRHVDRCATSSLPHEAKSSGKYTDINQTNLEFNTKYSLSKLYFIINESIV